MSTSPLPVDRVRTTLHQLHTSVREILAAEYLRRPSPRLLGELLVQANGTIEENPLFRALPAVREDLALDPERDTLLGNLHIFSMYLRDAERGLGPRDAALDARTETWLETAAQLVARAQVLFVLWSDRLAYRRFPHSVIRVGWTVRTGSDFVELRDLEAENNPPFRAARRGGGWFVDQSPIELWDARAMRPM